MQKEEVPWSNACSWVCTCWNPLGMFGPVPHLGILPTFAYEAHELVVLSFSAVRALCASLPIPPPLNSSRAADPRDALPHTPSSLTGLCSVSTPCRDQGTLPDHAILPSELFWGHSKFMLQSSFLLKFPVEKRAKASLSLVPQFTALSPSPGSGWFCHTLPSCLCSHPSLCMRTECDMILLFVMCLTLASFHCLGL